MEEQDPDDITALVLLQRIYRSPQAPVRLPFESPKLSAMVLSSVDPNEFARALDRAITRSGKRGDMKVIEHIPEATK